MAAINDVRYFIIFYLSLHFQGDPTYGFYSKGAKGDKGHKYLEVSMSHLSKILYSLYHSIGLKSDQKRAELWHVQKENATGPRMPPILQPFDCWLYWQSYHLEIYFYLYLVLFPGYEKGHVGNPGSPELPGRPVSCSLVIKTTHLNVQCTASAQIWHRLQSEHHLHTQERVTDEVR